MSNSSRLLTMAMPWRKVCAVLPAVALIGGGIASSAPSAPARDIKAVVVSSHSRAIVVPDIALVIPPIGAIPTGSARISVDPHAVAAPETPALVLPKGTVPGSSTPVTLDSSGIPVSALEAYRDAASLVDAADPGCHIDWALLAAIGRVESNHGRFAGNQLDSAGVAQPGIIGIPLDGSNGTARITDSDGGRLDRDTSYDRAVGPMQFIPSTWRVAGADADGDGVKNPQDMADATTATAVYLCSGPGDLSQPGDLRAAIMRYNPSDSYARTVTAIADAYRHGVTVLPASVLPASDPPPASAAPSTTSLPARPATKTAKIAAGKPAPAQPGSSPTRAPRQQPPVTLGAPAPVTTTPVTTPTPAPTPDPTPTASTPTSTPTPGPTPTACTPTPTPDPTASTSTPTSTPTLGPTPTACTPTPDPTPTVSTSKPTASTSPTA